MKNIKQRCWIRPDENVHGCNYEKLLESEAHGNWEAVWVSALNFKQKYLDNAVLDKVHILGCIPDAMAWKMTEATADDDLLLAMEYNNVFQKMRAPIHVISFLETCPNGKMLSWSSFPKIEDMFGLAPTKEDSVWLVQAWKMQLSKTPSTTLFVEAWLDECKNLPDGSVEWTSSAKSKQAKELRLTRCATSSSNPSYETVKWSASMPCMFTGQKEILAISNAQELMLDSGSFMLQGWYCIAKRVDRREYEHAKKAMDEKAVVMPDFPNGCIVGQTLYDDSVFYKPQTLI